MEGLVVKAGFLVVEEEEEEQVETLPRLGSVVREVPEEKVELKFFFIDKQNE